MSGSIAIEGGPRVAYLGPESSFSHLATRFRFGASVAAVPVDTIPAVFRTVEAGRDVSFGVVPIENTIEGPVGVTLDSFRKSELKVYAEHYIRVELNLLVPPPQAEIALTDIRKLYTIKIAREQCRQWLETNLRMRDVEVVETSSTAAAAKPPGSQPMSASAKSTMRRAIPPAVMTEPATTKNGMASKTFLSVRPKIFSTMSV